MGLSPIFFFLWEQKLPDEGVGAGSPAKAVIKDCLSGGEEALLPQHCSQSPAQRENIMAKPSRNSSTCPLAWTGPTDAFLQQLSSMISKHRRTVALRNGPHPSFPQTCA